MKNSLSYVTPLFPAHASTMKEQAEAAKKMNLHYCLNPSDIPHADLKLVDCIEDLKGRYFLRTHTGCCQVTYCPICGEKSRSQP